MADSSELFALQVDDSSFSLTQADLEGLVLYASDKSNHFSVIIGEKVYQVELLDFDAVLKQMRLKINHQAIRVDLKDQLDQLVEKMGISVNTEQIVDSIKAPMPGLVLEVLVEEGQSIEKGDNLLILEAMKMENIIKAPRTGVVAEVDVEKSQAVEKGANLIRLE